MAAEEERFREFFHAATAFDPYAWQTRVAVDGLPEILSVPTGLGKTEGSVLAWAWRRFANEDGEPPHLVYCLPMRSLVRQTAERLRRYFAELKEWNRRIDTPVHQLIGGDTAEAWAAAPDRPWVLVGTQDMLLSRALNRGYGISRFDWPVHFGLLNQDCRWIVDEVQLMGPGLWTTAQLDWMRRKRFPGLKPCRTTWMSATMGAQFLQTTDRRRDRCDTVEPFDPPLERDSSEALKLRRAALRPVELHQPATGKKARPLAEQIASKATAAHQPGTLTLIVCNTVKTGQAVFKQLGAGGPPKILLTSRFRAGDRREAEETLRAFESRRSASPSGRVKEDDPGLICVSTQVVEAGLDISARRLWTEHAPWPSLLQRLGRLNRDGKDNEARAIVWGTKPDNRGMHEGPYRKAALDQASALLGAIAPLSEQKTAAEALSDLQAQKPEEYANALTIPPEPCPRALDVHGLFSTEPDLYGGFTDVSRFVRNADPDADLSVFWRDWDGSAPPTGDALDGPPLDMDAEACPVALSRLRNLLETDHAAAWLWSDQAERWERAPLRDLRPGMTVMLRSDVGGYSKALGWTGAASDRLNGLPLPGRPRALSEDWRAEAGYWSSLASHLADAGREAERLCDALALQRPIRTAVVSAAGLHDLGKAHPDWQAAVPDGLDREVLAKFPKVLRVEVAVQDAERARAAIGLKLAVARPLSDEETNEGSALLRWALERALDRSTLEGIRALPWVRKAAHRVFRPGLRHEAASALAMWRLYSASSEAPYPALAVYLAAAHHGKVRTVLRAISRAGGDVFGVGRTPAALRFDGRQYPMDFSVAFDGADGEWVEDGFALAGPGWTGVVADVLGPWRGNPDAAWTGSVPKGEPLALGPFALAWLEALVRVADWRATDHPSHIVRVGGGG
ncbi:MAG: type I-G CRISPR-associated helicase/endonuclease Cas3g [Terriglobales bacterium]